MTNPKFDVNNAEDFQRIMGDRLKTARKRQINMDKLGDDTPHVHHMQVANLVLKILHTLKIDPIIKKVMSMRIIGPLQTGKETSRLSIALELGIRELEVEEIENAGLEILDHYLKKTNSPEFVEKFNREKSLLEEINKIKKGKS